MTVKFGMSLLVCEELIVIFNTNLKNMFYFYFWKFALNTGMSKTFG